MRKQFMTGGLLALAVAITGCGGGGSSSPSSPPPSGGTDNPPTSPAPGGAKVAGPLDAVQGPVSQDVIAPLAASFAGTPMQGVAMCVDQIVVNSAVDVLDVLALAIQSGAGSTNPQAALAAAASGVQVQVENIVIDLQGMLSALSGNSSGCLGNTAPTAVSGNPLAGTPLAPVGATLSPVLDQVYSALHGTGPTRPELSLTTIASLVAQLQFAVDTAMAQVPANIANAPVMGAALTTIQTAVRNINTTVTAASSSNTAATRSAIATTLNNLLTGVLLGVVPVNDIENQAGQPGLLSGPISTGIGQVSTQVSSNLGVVLQPVLSQNLTAVINPIIASIENTILAAIVGPLFTELGGAGTLPTNPFGPVVAVLEDFFDGSSQGDPLDLITTLINTSSGCPLAGTPLAALCPP
jgi:hypothetical protein